MIEVDYGFEGGEVFMLAPAMLVNVSHSNNYLIFVAVTLRHGF